MSVKKAFKEFVDLLEANKDKKVSSILPQIIELASSRGRSSTGAGVIRDANNNVVAIMDYYFKRWMPIVGPKAVEFGAKAGSNTGLNVMCKEAVSLWTRQQRLAKQANADLLERVKKGEVAITEIEAEQAKIEEQRNTIEPTELGFDDLEQLMKYLKKNHEVEIAA